MYSTSYTAWQHDTLVRYPISAYKLTAWNLTLGEHPSAQRQVDTHLNSGLYNTSIFDLLIALLQSSEFVNMADIIIVGGGLAGTVIASRLHERKPEFSIVLIEAGRDPTGNPHVVDPAGAANLHFSEFDYNYTTTPQAHLDGKPKRNVGFKGLGGGTVINSGMYPQGSRVFADGL